MANKETLPNSNKKRLFILLISCILMLTAFATGAYAWIITSKTTPPIDGSATGIKYVYSLDGQIHVQTMDYSITNIVFFDNNDTNEIEFFLDMACKIEIEIRNTGDMDISYILKQTKGLYDFNDTIAIMCLFSETEVVDSDISAYTTIQEMIEATDSPFTQEVTGDLVKYDTVNSTADFKTIYLYVIGIQTNDLSTNDFLNSAYDFTLTFNVVSKPEN